MSGALPSQSLPNDHNDLLYLLGLAAANAKPLEASTSVPRESSVQKLVPSQRRLSSVGQAKRRLSYAVAATKPSPQTLSAATAALSLSSPPPNHAILSKSVPMDSLVHASSPPPDAHKLKAAIYRCESCSKTYKHRNCLIKHQWEHTPHWRVASQYTHSKHQQVQVIEAAAILTERGLPEDRGLWPSHLSGGRIPAPSPITSGPVRRPVDVPRHATLAHIRPGLLGHPTPVKGAIAVPGREQETDIWAARSYGQSQSSVDSGHGSWLAGGGFSGSLSRSSARSDGDIEQVEEEDEDDEEFGEVEEEDEEEDEKPVWDGMEMDEMVM